MTTATEAAAILIVDDQERNLDALEAILDSSAYRLCRARSADEALLALLKGEFAAIVCDIKMPGTGGIEFARIIKQRKRTQHIPILFLTAHMVDEVDLLRGYGAGGVDYLTKPINPEILRLKVGVYVELFKKTRALAETNQALAEEVAERQRVEEALRISKEELEQRVQERTAELVSANRALRESKARMLLAMQNASMGIFSHDLRTGEILWSAAMESMFGLPPGGFEGTFGAFFERVHPEDRQRVKEQITASAERRADFDMEFRFLRPLETQGAAEGWMSAVGRFVLDEEDRPIHAVGVCTDVTSRRLAADELRVLKESAESANRAKDHFLAILSHELRTPLTPVLATVQSALDSSEVSAELRENLDLIHRNVELEARLIDDLLDLTRIERGKIELHRGLVDVHQILEHALRTCDADFQAKQISVRTALFAQSTCVVGDRARLLQVFWNLLKNAAKFTPAGQSVEIRTTNPSDRTFRVEVADTGIGIQPDRLTSIFNAFEQGAPDTTREYGGLGLGLSIGKALVELHGGAISAISSGLNQGSTFIVDLPVTLEVPAGSLDDDPHRVPAHEPRAQRPASSTRLLLIEDHPDTSRVMTRLLLRVGYEVTTADGVTAAIRACEAAPRPFDVIVSDIGLPDGSGLDLMRELRVRYPRIPAIALSGFGMEEDRRRSTEAGFSAHLTKPVDLLTLQSTLEQIMA